MAGDKTEEPTSKRLEEFRKEGRIAKSQELDGMLTLYIAISLWATYGPRIFSSMEEVMRRSYTSIHTIEPETITFTFLRELATQPAINVVLALLPWLATLMLVGVGANVAQTRGLVQPRLLIPKWSRFNPISRINRSTVSRCLWKRPKALPSR